MATATPSANVDPAAQPDPAISLLLGRLRLLIRAYVLLEGAAWCVVFAALTFWFSLAIDWLFEPPRLVRAALLLGYAAIVGGAFVRFVLSRLWTRLSDTSMAVLLERRYREYNDRLLTTIELSGKTAPQPGLTGDMLARTRREAAGLVDKTGALAVFDSAPLLRALALALLAGATVLIFATQQSGALSVWSGRTIFLGDQLWPRESRLIVEGFPVQHDGGRRVVKVAKGDGATISVLADAALTIPDVVEIRFASEAGVTGEQNMVRIGAADETSEYQPFRYKFDNVQSTTRFSVIGRHEDVFGKGDRIDDLWLEVVAPPNRKDILLHVEYPGYLGKSPETLPGAGLMSAPEGSRVKLEIEATKPLVQADCEVLGGENGGARLIEVQPLSSNPHRFICDLGALRANTEVLITLTDTDLVSNQQPIRLQVNIVPDEAPSVDARFVGIGSGITPNAMLPIGGDITDDYQVSKTWFEYRVDQGEPAQREFELPPTGQLPDEPRIFFDAANLGLQPGQKFIIGVQAADNYDLGGEPHVESSQRAMLDVVTEDELRALLETRELLLRRRFEELGERLTANRDSLGRINVGAIIRRDSAQPTPPSGTGVTEGTGVEEASEPPTEAAAEETPPETEAEPANETAEAEPAQTPTARLRSIALLSVEEAMQNIDRSGHETREISQSFEDILVELRNNRVKDISALEERLQTGIADPIREIADFHYPRLDTALRRFRAAVEDDDLVAAQTSHVAVERELNDILAAMQEILGRMKQQQNINEMIARLREIISKKQQIAELTKQRREELRDDLKKGLLED